MKRRTGYYWIKEYKTQDWEPALYYNSHEAWEIIGTDRRLSDDEILEVKKDECNREVYLKIPQDNYDVKPSVINKIISKTPNKFLCPKHHAIKDEPIKIPQESNIKIL